MMKDLGIPAMPYKPKPITAREYALRLLAKSDRPMSTTELLRPGKPSSITDILLNASLEGLCRRVSGESRPVLWEITERGKAKFQTP